MHQYTTETLLEKTYDFVSENILTAVVLLPFLYVIFFGEFGSSVSDLIPASLFQDLTVVIFLAVIIFGVAWVAVDEFQTRKASGRFDLSR